jgi:hypothetical protein
MVDSRRHRDIERVVAELHAWHGQRVGHKKTPRSRLDTEHRGRAVLRVVYPSQRQR